MYYSMILSRCYYKSSFWVVDKLFLPIIFNCEKFKFFRQQFRVLKFNFDKNVGQKYILVYIFLLAFKLRWWGWELCISTRERALHMALACQNWTFQCTPFYLFTFLSIKNKNKNVYPQEWTSVWVSTNA